MISKKLNDITLSDIQELINNEVGESKTIEYKSELHIEQGDERKEFLSDITSFANSEGGDLIYGIKENSDTNLPESLVGIPVTNEDELLRKIENLLRDAVSPRMPEIAFKLLLVLEGKYILIIRIGTSALSPHRVIYKGYDKFFARNSKGKYPIDVFELRAAFTRSQTLTKEIEAYKEEQLTAILTNKYQELLDAHPILVMFYIPVNAFRNNLLYSIQGIQQAMRDTNASAFGVTNTQQITIDGIKITNKTDYSSEIAHYQTNGIVNIAATDFFFPKYESQNRTPRESYNIISSNDIVEKLQQSLYEIKTYYKILEVNPPLILSCAILNGRGFGFPKRFAGFHRGTIDRDILLVPDVTVNDFNMESTQILKPLFDALWNACGYTSCPAYDADGKYVGLKREDTYF